MSHYAKIENNIVTNVIVAEQEFIDSGAVGDPVSWIQTSYNTSAGIHRAGGTPLRKNYAGIGYSYDKELDMFIPPKIFNSWILNKETGTWISPITPPNDGKYYVWNEEILNWTETEISSPIMVK